MNIVKFPFNGTCVERQLYFRVISQKLRNTSCEPTYGRRDIGLHAKWLVKRMAGIQGLLQQGQESEHIGAAIKDTLGWHQWGPEHLLAIVVVPSALVVKHW